MNPIEQQVKKAGLVLPAPSVPGGSYSSFNVRGNTAFIAIQFPILNGEFMYQGKLGSDISTQQGYEAMKLCGLNVLAQINKHINFSHLDGVGHLDIYYQHDDGWDDGPMVANGASDLFTKVLEDKGAHSRSILGVRSLPRNFSVGLTATARIVNKRHWFFL